MNFKRIPVAILLSILLGLSPVAFASAEMLQQDAKKPLTNTDVIGWVQEKITDDEIIQTIQASDTQFDLTALTQLRDAGVSGRVRDAMRAAEARKRAASQVTQPSQGAGQSTMTNSSSPPQQPLAFRIDGEAKQPLSVARTQVARAKAKGNDLASLAVNGAVGEVLTTAAATAAVHAATSVATATGSALAAVPFLGIGVGLVSGIMGRNPTVTYLWALPGQASSTVLQTNALKFEVVYGSIPGVNPDEYEPTIVKLVSTNNNWRLVGATRAKIDVYQAATPEWEVYSGFAEQRVPTRLSKLGRGRVQVEPAQPLEPGEYGLVLRPISPKKKFSGTAVANGQQEGLLFNSVWDFSVGSNPVAQ